MRTNIDGFHGPTCLLQYEWMHRSEELRALRDLTDASRGGAARQDKERVVKQRAKLIKQGMRIAVAVGSGIAAIGSARPFMVIGLALGADMRCIATPRTRAEKRS